MHYSGEVKNVYTTLWKIYSGLYYKILSESAGFYKRCDKNILMFFSGSQFQLLFTYKTRTQSFTR